MADPPEETPAEAGSAPPKEARPKRRLRLPRRRPREAPAAEGDAAPADAPDADASVPDALPPAPPRPERAGALRRRRRRLLSRREEAVYHLGGLAFELYRRDLLREEVMRLRAGEVAQLDDSVRDIDARLFEMDRIRRERRGGGGADAHAGNCLDCRAPFRAEARYCWQCGVLLAPVAEGDDQPTAVIATRPEGAGEP
jgi:hypothetical protein